MKSAILVLVKTELKAFKDLVAVKDKKTTCSSAMPHAF